MISNDVDQYINKFSGDKLDKLVELRQMIKSEFPFLVEKISYAMPSYSFYGSVVHFASHQLHFGLYPGPEAIKEYANELTDYETSKGAIKFPYGEALPMDTIKKVIQYNVDVNVKKKNKNVISFPGGDKL